MTEPQPPARRWWQLRLRTSILLVMVAALTLGIVRDRLQIPRLLRLANRLAQQQAQRPVVVDPDRVATQKIFDSAWLQDRWEVYLPPGRGYRFCLATRVGDISDRPTSFRSVPIESGRHLLTIDKQPIGDGWRVVAGWGLVDRVAIDESSDWDPSSWSGAEFGELQVPVGQPVRLTWGTFYQPQPTKRPPPPGPARGSWPGLQVWIEPEPATPAAAGATSGPGGTPLIGKSPPAR